MCVGAFGPIPTRPARAARELAAELQTGRPRTPSPGVTGCARHRCRDSQQKLLSKTPTLQSCDECSGPRVSSVVC